MKFYRSDNNLFTLIILVLILMFLPIIFIKIVMPLLFILLIYKFIKNLSISILNLFKVGQGRAAYGKKLSGQGMIIDIEAEKV